MSRFSHRTALFFVVFIFFLQHWWETILFFSSMFLKSLASVAMFTIFVWIYCFVYCIFSINVAAIQISVELVREMFSTGEILCVRCWWRGNQMIYSLNCSSSYLFPSTFHAHWVFFFSFQLQSCFGLLRSLGAILPLLSAHLFTQSVVSFFLNLLFHFYFLCTKSSASTLIYVCISKNNTKWRKLCRERERDKMKEEGRWCGLRRTSAGRDMRAICVRKGEIRRMSLIPSRAFVVDEECMPTARVMLIYLRGCCLNASHTNTEPEVVREMLLSKLIKRRAFIVYYLEARGRKCKKSLSRQILID